MGLSDLQAKIPVHERKTVDIDISDAVGEAPGTEVLVIREPRIQDLSDAEDGVQSARKNNPDLSRDGAYHVLLLAKSHRSPQAEYPEAFAFYSHMATLNEPVFASVRQKFYAAFPWLIDLMGRAADRKNE